MTYQPTFYSLFKPQPRYVNASRAGRRHLIGADIMSAVHTGFRGVEGSDKARRRLNQLIQKLQRVLGDRTPLGGWRFANEREFRAYKQSLQSLMGVINRMPAATDGICWLIVGMGWAADLHAEAVAAGRDDLARAWRPILNLLDGLFLRYDGEDLAELSWEPGKRMLEDLKRESGTWA